MNMKNLTVGRKITLGFGIVLTLLCVLAAWSYIGIGSITGNAGSVIYGNQLDSTLAQLEVDHLNWAKTFTELITNDDVATLNIQTNHQKCTFGKWLYGDGCRNAEKLVPSLVPLLRKIALPNIVSRTNTAFGQVKQSVEGVSQLVAEIAAASGEQAQGIGQINTAVTEMDKVTQQVASNAEESASASAEMSAQAVQMKAVAGQLAAMVNGTSQKRKDTNAVTTI